MRYEPRELARLGLPAFSSKNGVGRCGSHAGRSLAHRDIRHAQGLLEFLDQVIAYLHKHGIQLWGIESALRPRGHLNR